MFDIIIIGAGIAGLTSSIYAKRANKKVLVLESSNYGGQIINAEKIDNYPGNIHISGFDLATNIYNQALELGVDIKMEKVIEIKNGDVKEVKTENNVYSAKSIIIATGLKNRKLGLENEEKFTGKGISYCATCDGMFFKDKIVCVAGGGNVAVEDALYLSDVSKKVYLIHRNNELKADKISVDKLKEKENVKILLNCNITRILGDNKLESIEIKDKSDNIIKIDTDGLFIAIGKVPDNTNFNDLLKKDEQGYIEVDKNLKTSLDGIYAAGDIVSKEVRQLVTAASDGAIAAINAIKYINN